jgi:hypothetical protein
VTAGGAAQETAAREFFLPSRVCSRGGGDPARRGAA